MCRFFFPSFGNLLFALSLCYRASNSIAITSCLSSELLVGTRSASSVEKTSNALPQRRRLETAEAASYTSINVSATLCSGASGRPADSKCKIARLPVGSGNRTVQASNLTRTVTTSSPTKLTTLSEWQNSLRSKPGTSEFASRELSTGSINHATTATGISSVPTETLSLLTARLANAKNTIVIYETTTDCDLLQNGSSSSWVTSRNSNISRPAVPSITIMPSSGASSANPNVFLPLSSNFHSKSMEPITTTFTTAQQETSISGGLPCGSLSFKNGSISSIRHSRAASEITISRSSRTPLPIQSSYMTSSLQITSFEPSPSLEKSSLLRFLATSRPSKAKSNSSNDASLSVEIGEVDDTLSRSTVSRTSFRFSPSLITSSSSSNSTISTRWSEVDAFYERLSPSDNIPNSRRTSGAPLITSRNTTFSGPSRPTSILSSRLRASSGLTSRLTSSHISSQSTLISSSLATNRSIPLTTCAAPSQPQPVTTSWMAGACKLTSFDDPTSTLKCASSIRTPLPITACACPDGQFYEQMAGGTGPCNDYTSIAASEFLEPILTCTDLPTNCIPHSTSLTPTSAPPPIPYGGHFSAIPAYPSTCNATTITYSSTKPLATGQIMIDSSIGWGNASSQWKFRAGGGVKIDRINNTSNPGTSRFSGNWEPSENFTKNADGSWTMTVVPDMRTAGSYPTYKLALPMVTNGNAASLSLIVVTSGGSANKTFPFTVTSVIPCDKPVALQCNNSFSDLTQSQWVAFEVDKFVTMIENEFRATKGPNFFDWFLNEYVGDTIKAPCQIDQEGCQPLSDPCTFVKPGPYQRQAFFVVNAMITLSRYIRYAWLAYERSRGDLLSELAAWTSAFIVPQRTQTWQNIVAITASVFGILSVIGFAAGPFMPVTAAIFTPLFVGALSSGLFGVNSLLNTAINSANVNGAAVAAEVQFDGYAKADQAMDAYINASEQALIDTNNAYFLHGTNLSQVLQGGLFVANTPIAELTDGDFSGAVTAAADWFDKTMIWSLINEAWKSDDNYIVFLPYGPVKWYSGDTKQFTAQMCHDQFLGNKHWNSTIYGSCDAGPPSHPGFASFMTAQKLEDFNEYNKKSYYEVSYSYQNYNFDADDVFKSSIAGYYQSGYNYNATSIPVGQLLTEQNQQPIAEYINQTATSPGIFNVPVCIISDTSYVPGCTISNWGDRGDPCYTSPKQCLQSKWIDPRDSTHVQNFTSYVSKNVVSGLQDATTYDNLWKR